MDSKQSKKLTKEIVKSMRASKNFKPGDLLKSKRKPGKKIVATFGLI